MVQPAIDDADSRAAVDGVEHGRSGTHEQPLATDHGATDHGGDRIADALVLAAHAWRADQDPRRLRRDLLRLLAELDDGPVE